MAENQSIQDLLSELGEEFTPEQAAGLRAYNERLAEQFRVKQGQVTGDFAGAPLLLLTTTGAKSGQQRTTPLVYSQDGDHFVVIASKAGLSTNPDWYYNLLAQPDAVLELPGQRFSVRARLAEGSERRRLFDQQAAMMPVFLHYEKRAPREIPVFVLERRA